MLGALALGTSRIENFLDGGDCRATASVLRQLGVTVEFREPTSVVIEGKGWQGLREPLQPLDCGSSGTTMRLMAGVLCGQNLFCVLTGSEQLLARPMDRIVTPLRLMAATILGRAESTRAPLAIRGGPLHPVDYALPVASAQIKSCVLLAAQFADGITTVRESVPSRDHTERMLAAMGAPVHVQGSTVVAEPASGGLEPLTLTVPGDMSSAAFLIVAACLCEGSCMRVPHVGLNPTRTGVLQALCAMGADVQQWEEDSQGGEPVGEVLAQSSALHGARFDGEAIVSMIDELPILAVAATQASGESIVANARELRVKETDRIAATVAELRKMGARIEERDDGMVIEGPVRLRGARVDSRGDHRLAMALTVAGLVADGPTEVVNYQVSADSFPGFENTLRSLGADLEER